jgi:phage tail-like protein
VSDFSLPVAFHFTVAVDGAGDDVDAAFQEVSGLEAEMEVETVTEGGENRFVHRLPKAVKHPNLVLKRGLAPSGRGLAGWCADVLEKDLSQPIKPRNVTVSLCDEDGDPVRSWAISGAFPVKWSVGGFDAMKNAMAIETIELAYRTLKRKA